MATKKEPEAEPESAPMNREQRRRAKFGKAGKVHQHDAIGPWPEVETNPALRNATGDQAAEAEPPTPAEAEPEETSADKPEAKPKA